MIQFLQNIARFVLLTLIQVFVLNNIQFLGFINPYIYLLFILLLPVRFPRWLSLVLAFVLGIIIDSFMNTPGVHTFSTVLIAFLRNPVIKLYIAIEEGANPEPSLLSFGVPAMVKYVITMVMIHHFSFFLLETFSFEHSGMMLLKILLNATVSILIILGILSFKRR
jgi:rod shape-determining protein MreD